MKIYNTLSKSVETVHNVSDSAQLGMYACGPTVYDYAHIGHWRKYTSDDVLRRTLELADFRVQHIMNITDVGHLTSDADTGEDKMEKGARKTGKTVWEVAAYFEENFWQDFDAMQLQRPHVAPRATDHIPEQIAQVQALESRGFTYEIPGDGIYFDTSKDPHYGELAQLKLDQQKGGARVDATGKRHPADFALWKFSTPEEKRGMEWDSPWGRGFPGWHIECSAMSTKYLGEQFALHTGGIDHIPVHHTNEIAQAENATGKRPFVRYWAHYNFLLVDGQKMSKSLENFYRLTDVVERGISPMALKMLFLSAHYSDELNFTWESAQAAQNGYEKLVKKVRALAVTAGFASWEAVPADFNEADISDIDRQLWQKFTAALQDDLKTAQAQATLWAAVKKADVRVVKKMLLVLGIGV